MVFTICSGAKVTGVFLLEELLFAHISPSVAEFSSLMRSSNPICCHPNCTGLDYNAIHLFN
jgi:hypothetical protein